MGGKILDYPTKTLWRKAQRDKLVEQVQKKLQMGDSIEKIADDLVEDIEIIKEIVDELRL